MTTLTKTATVLNLGTASVLCGATFTRLDEDTNELEWAHVLDYTAWLDMGSPAQITVTVEPGDRLTDESETVANPDSHEWLGVDR
jgi:hypothetical protein